MTRICSPSKQCFRVLRKEDLYEIAIIAGLVSHPARPPRLDSVPSDSVCAVAGSLDTFTNPIRARRTQLSRFKRLPVTQEVAGLATPIAPALWSYGSAVCAVADW